MPLYMIQSISKLHDVEKTLVESGFQLKFERICTVLQKKHASTVQKVSWSSNEPPWNGRFLDRVHPEAWGWRPTFTSCKVDVVAVSFARRIRQCYCGDPTRALHCQAIISRHIVPDWYLQKRISSVVEEERLKSRYSFKHSHYSCHTSCILRCGNDESYHQR